MSIVLETIVSAGGTCASGVNPDGSKNGAPIDCAGAPSNDPPANPSDTCHERKVIDELKESPEGCDCEIGEAKHIVSCVDSAPGLNLASCVAVEAHVSSDVYEKPAKDPAVVRAKATNSDCPDSSQLDSS